MMLNDAHTDMESQSCPFAHIPPVPVAGLPLNTPVNGFKATPLGKPRARGHVKVMVFNGNGQEGAAGSAATKLQGLGYKISGTANAKRQDYATTVVMYRPGFRAEGIRLAKDIGSKVVGPLDGLRTRALDGGDVAVIVGA